MAPAVHRDPASKSKPQETRIDERIARALDELASRQLVQPGEIPLLVAQVASELLEAVTGESAAVSQHEVNFPNGISILFHPPEQITDLEDVANEATSASFQIVAFQTGRNRTIRAQASYKGPPAIFVGDQITFWTELDGPPRELILSNLRNQVAHFLDSFRPQQPYS